MFVHQDMRGRPLIETRLSDEVMKKLRENVRAGTRVTVKKILGKYNYAPDEPGKAVRTVMEHAELACKNVVKAPA